MDQAWIGCQIAISVVNPDNDKWDLDQNQNYKWDLDPNQKVGSWSESK